MKKLILAASIAALSTGFAATKTDSTTTVDNTGNFKPRISKGFNLGLTAASNPTIKLKTTINEKESSKKYDQTSQSAGIKFGYQDIQLKSLGYALSGQFSQYEVDKKDLNSLRLAGDLNYGLSESFYLSAGVNLNLLSGEDKLFNYTGDKVKLDPSIGFQIGAGYNINKKFALGFSYYQTNNSGKYIGLQGLEVVDLELEMNIRAVELGASYIF